MGRKRYFFGGLGHLTLIDRAPAADPGPALQVHVEQGDGGAIAETLVIGAADDSPSHMAEMALAGQEKRRAKNKEQVDMVADRNTATMRDYADALERRERQRSGRHKGRKLFLMGS